MKSSPPSATQPSAAHWLETPSDFEGLIAKQERPVVLGEGRRELPAGESEKIRDFARSLAVRFPSVILRTGNAPGADDSFAAGFASVDPARIEYILPTATHRRAYRNKRSRSVSLAEVGEAGRDLLAQATVSASPGVERIIGLRDSIPRLGAKANYLLRDTLKVSGMAELPDQPPLDPPVAALFWAEPADPMAGGTGHTIRVCLDHGIPTALQAQWQSWAVTGAGL
jgi:hypothetical protein